MSIKNYTGAEAAQEAAPGQGARTDLRLYAGIHADDMDVIGQNAAEWWLMGETLVGLDKARDALDEASGGRRPGDDDDEVVYTRAEAYRALARLRA